MLTGQGQEQVELSVLCGRPELATGGRVFGRRTKAVWKLIGLFYGKALGLLPEGREAFV